MRVWRCLSSGLRSPQRQASTTQFVKFSPLPHKSGHNTSSKVLYTGPPFFSGTDAYYRNRVDEKIRDPFWKLFSPHYREGTAYVHPDSVEVDDLLEITSRDGQVRFGIVTFSTVGECFDLLDLDGKTSSARKSEVSFLFRPGPRHEAGSGTRSQAIMSNYSKEVQLDSLIKFVETSVAIADSLLPYVGAAYASYSVASRSSAVNFEDLVSEVLRCSAAESSKRVAKGVHKFAVYMAAAYHNLFFVRTGNSPFVVISRTSADAVQKVMWALTPSELDDSVRALARRLKDSEAWVPLQAGPLLRFLKHYVLFGDQRLANAVMNIMSQIFPDEEKTTSLIRPSRVYELLRDTRLLDSSPLLVEGSIAWPSRTPGVLTDGLHSGLDVAGRPQLEGSVDEGKFEVFEQRAYFIEKDIAFSLDAHQDPDRYLISIHIPVLPVASVLKRLNVLGIRSKTFSAGSQTLPLVSPSLADHYGFSQDKETTCLTLSAFVKPWNGEWERDTTSVRWTRVTPLAVEKGFFNSNSSFGLQAVHDTNTLQNLKRVFLAQADRRLDSHTDHEFPFRKTEEAFVTQARILAGEFCGEWCAQKDLDVPYLVKRLFKEYPLVNEPGPIGPEVVSRDPGPYEPLGARTYVPVGYIFDSTLSILAQQQLAKQFNNNFRSTRREIEQGGCAAAYNRVVLPKGRLVNTIAERYDRFEILERLQQELAGKESFYLFPCTISEPVTYPGLAPAFCSKLGMNVDVLVSPSTTVQKGDTVLCTEILELDVVQGTLVVGM